MNLENTVVITNDETEFYNIKEKFALTRYLYCKMDVLASLFMAILEKDYTQAIFWAEEIYYSGWKKEVADYLMAIYKECFKRDNPKLGRFLKRRYSDITQDLTLDHGNIVATMARNLADPSRKYCIAEFVNCIVINNNTSSNYKESNIYVIIDIADTNTQNTNISINTVPRHILKTACKYETRKDMRSFLEYESDDEMGQSKLHRDNWLYFASFSPIWAERISKYHGTANDEDQTIDFANEDDEEEFYEKYNYEVDEQSLELQNKIMLTEHTNSNNNNKQMTKHEFIQKYGKDVELNNNIKIKIRIKKHKQSLL